MNIHGQFLPSYVLLSSSCFALRRSSRKEFAFANVVIIWKRNTQNKSTVWEGDNTIALVVCLCGYKRKEADSVSGSPWQSRGKKSEP